MAYIQQTDTGKWQTFNRHILGNGLHSTDIYEIMAYIPQRDTGYCLKSHTNSNGIMAYVQQTDTG